MPLVWPPSPWNEIDLYRDGDTRLPTQLYPFRIEQDGDVWVLAEEVGSGRISYSGRYGNIWEAFRAMLSAYESWFPARPQEQVYFIGEAIERNRLVKVGFSRNPRARLGQLQTSSPKQLRILALTPGGKDVETDYHRRWKHYRKAGEWFVMGDPILKEIDRILAGKP